MVTRVWDNTLDINAETHTVNAVKRVMSMTSIQLRTDIKKMHAELTRKNTQI